MPKSIIHEAKPGLIVHEWTKQRRASSRTGVPAHNDGENTGWVQAFVPQNALAYDLIPSHDPYTMAGRTSLKTLAGRRSIRHYGDTPLTTDELAQVMTLCSPPGTCSGTTGDAPQARLRRWHSVATSCTLFPLVLRVTGLQPGGYLYDAQRQRLIAVRQDDPLPLMQAACFQTEFAHASVVMLLVGSLSDSIARYGDRGYRYLLIDAGTMLQRLYLAVSALGLNGCATGSIVHGGFSTCLGLDGYQGTVLMAFALGHAPEREASHG